MAADKRGLFQSLREGGFFDIVWIFVVSTVLGSLCHVPLLGLLCSLRPARRLGATLKSAAPGIVLVSSLIGILPLLDFHVPIAIWDLLTPVIVAIVLFYIARFGAREQTLSDDAAKAAETDDLTGALNRPGFLSALKSQVSLVGPDQPLAVGFLDCDQFKEFNDRQGHLAGNRYLAIACDVISRNVAGAGRVGRFGGDEFNFYLSGLNREELESRIARLQAELNSLSQRMGARSGWTIGVVMTCERHHAEELIDLADRVMLEGKREQVGGARIRELESKEVPA